MLPFFETEVNRTQRNNNGSPVIILDMGPIRLKLIGRQLKN